MKEKFPGAFSPSFELNIYFNSCPPKTSVKPQMFWEQGWLFPWFGHYTIYVPTSLLITWPTSESKEGLSLTKSPRSFLPRKPFLYIGLWHFRCSIFLNFHLIDWVYPTKKFQVLSLSSGTWAVHPTLVLPAYLIAPPALQIFIYIVRENIRKTKDVWQATRDNYRFLLS